MLPKIIISIIIIAFSCLLIFASKSSNSLELSYFIENSLDKNPQVLGVSEEDLPESFTLSYPKARDEYKEPVKNLLDQAPELLSERALVMDYNTEAVLFEKDAETKVPIASITKLATALTFLDFNPGWEEIYQIKKTDIATGGRAYLSVNDQLSIRDLFNMSLICSSNTGANALASASGLTEEEFVKAMNEKIKKLGLGAIEFVEPTGLNSLNTASARDLAKFAKEALSNPQIRQATMQPEYHFKTLAGREIKVANTDSMIKAFPQNGIEIQGGKTGFINLAGYCFVGCFKNKDNRELVSVILGSPDRKTSFLETKKMVNWAYNSFVWE